MQEMREAGVAQPKYFYAQLKSPETQTKLTNSDITSDTEPLRPVTSKLDVPKWSLHRGPYSSSEYYVTKDKRGPVSLKSLDCVVMWFQLDVGNRRGVWHDLDLRWFWCIQDLIWVFWLHPCIVTVSGPLLCRPRVISEPGRCSSNDQQVSVLPNEPDLPVSETTGRKQSTYPRRFIIPSVLTNKVTRKPEKPGRDRNWARGKQSGRWNTGNEKKRKPQRNRLSR